MEGNDRDDAHNGFYDYGRNSRSSLPWKLILGFMGCALALILTILGELRGTGNTRIGLMPIREIIRLSLNKMVLIISWAGATINLLIDRLPQLTMKKIILVIIEGTLSAHEIIAVVICLLVLLISAKTLLHKHCGRFTNWQATTANSEKCHSNDNGSRVGRR